MSENSLVPIGDAQLGETRFEDWLKTDGDIGRIGASAAKSAARVTR